MSKKSPILGALPDMGERLSAAVAQFWQTRGRQGTKQASGGRHDQGARAEVTGGAQMDGFAAVIADLVKAAGIDEASIFRKRAVELPGYFRPTKEWDLLVVAEGRLLVAVEAKSHVGPSFGNNFNNRTEEAMGSALDIWTAYREGAFPAVPRPWIGYLLLLEDSEQSRRSVAAKEPHFKVFEEFRGASYAKRYELFCRKLLKERHYSAAAFLTSSREAGLKGRFAEPADDLSFSGFAASLWAHVTAHVATNQGRK